MPRGRKPSNRVAEFHKRYVVDEMGCWVWQDALNNGYGDFWNGERQVRAHRYSYELHRGPIPEGLVMDHLCRNPACVNPDHLEAVTHGENVRRGQGSWKQNSQKVNCKRGHPLADTNLIVDNLGRRSCRECRKVHMANFKERHPGYFEAYRERGSAKERMVTNGVTIGGVRYRLVAEAV